MLPDALCARVWRLIQNPDGSKVNIWRDPWIPRAWSRRVITARNGNLLERVNGLISPVDGRWDTQLIPGLNGDERGNTSSGGQRDLRADVDRFWTRIWKLACPGKIKMFVWRLAHDSLAVRANLIRKGMVLEEEWCPMCVYVREDSAHLFMKCKKVKEVWRDLELEGTRMRMENTVTAGEALNIIWELPERKIMEGIHFMWHWVEMESDSELLVNAVNSPCMDFSKHAVVLDDLKMQMRTWFFFCEVKACSREVNMAAHSLAKLGVACDADYALYWEYGVPAHVVAFVRGDLHMPY
ncbi:hypothetical protein D1007_51235 [Hordeum vulgare]|nr:hypothetical protein D1007_51235 [Hordeum vulgare]